MSARLTLALLLIAATLPLGAQQRPDRTTPPAPGPTPTLSLPAPQKFTLANGLRVWLLEQHDVPLVQANLVVLSGASADRPR